MAENLPTWACSPRRGGPALYLRSTEQGGKVTFTNLEDKRGYVLGRNKACNIVVKDKTASRFHACLAYDEHGDCYLVDLGSAYGETMGSLRCVANCWDGSVEISHDASA
jgi:pSer/pThr/pTyr-binding forkhead associated (FHA) protein